MSKAIRASVLVLLLACSAQAGYIPNGTPEPPPPSQPASATENEAAEGYIPNDVAATLADAALSVLNSMLALL